MRSIQAALYALLFSPLALASGPIPSLSVTLRGKSYDVHDVTTVKELQEQLESQSGVSASQQGRIIFDGKRLAAETVLSEAGVPTDGSAKLNMVPAATKKKSKKPSTSAAAVSATKQSSTTTSDASPAAFSNPMADYLKESGMHTSQLDEMMKSMGGGSDGMPSMEESMKAMSEAMKMMSDPERLEESRQMILNNPMLKSMMAGMPGMEDILNDKDAWRQAMQAAAELYKNMDSDTLMKSMMEGAAAAGAPPGMFDGTLDDSAATAALDELDEDD